MDDQQLRTAIQVVYRECLGVSLPQVARAVDGYLDEIVHSKEFTRACGCRSAISTLEILLSPTTPTWKMAVRAAASGGHLHVLKWMAKPRMDGRGPWKADLLDAIIEAAVSRHLGVAIWLHESCLVQCSPATNLVNKAAGSGNLEMLKWCLEYHPGSLSIKALKSAARNGHLHIVQWIDKEVPESYSRSNAITSAANNGHLKVLQWFHANRPNHWPRDVMFAAVTGGHLDVAQWLYFYDNSFRGCRNDAAEAVARLGKIEMLVWLHEHSIYKFTSCVMDIAASKGYLGMVKWLHNNRREGCSVRAMDRAAGEGYLEIVQWLHANRREGCTTDAMDWAAEHGQLSVVQWLHENRTEGCTTNAMDGAADNGYLEW